MDTLDFSDLSEDWISQPRSSDPVVSKDESALRSSIRSKIPVPARRSTSIHVLHEKTASAVNATQFKDAQQQASSVVPPEAFSGTIQHHDVAQIAAVKQATPEWKKKLQKANGKSQDLFSPIGLEKMFRPPTVKNQTPYPKRVQKAVTPSEIVPSSPPVMDMGIKQDQISVISEDSVQLPPIRAAPQTGPQHGMRKRMQSGASSNKSALGHERFSPVVLGQKRAISSRNVTTKISSRMTSYESQRSPSSLSDSVLHLPNSRLADDADSMSLPDYSELESQQLDLDSKLITTKRGGFSRDGSFKTRPLTPSSYQPGVVSSLPSSETSDIFVVQDAPLTPGIRKGLCTVNEESPQRQKSSGSPLKLFDKYDTFTNDRLNRRISQFETTVAAENDDSDIEQPRTPSPRHGKASRRKQRMSSFGEGELDKFDFTHSNSDGAAPCWPNQGQLAHGNTLYREFENAFDDDDTEDDAAGEIEQKGDAALDRHDFQDAEQDNKRAPSSPHRVPDSKRRRVQSKESSSEGELNPPRQRPLVRSTSSMAGNKRKDAKHGDRNETADADILAQRQMLEPSSPFRKLSRAFSKILEKGDAQYIDVNAATSGLADELASLAVTIAEDVVQGTRKKSVTTADFFREAAAIMRHIRSKATHRSPVPAVPPITDTLTRPSGFQEELFSDDELDRPASREGGSPPRKRNPTMDKRVVSQLRKFADGDELGLTLNSSFNALRLQELHTAQDLDSFESDRTDIRILDPIVATQEDHQYGTEKTTSSNTTNSSVPTGSSSTRTKTIIEPHKVSHLLTDTIGGMTFDHQRQCWIKKRSQDIQHKRHGRLGSEMTDDDPFADIPDLEDNVPLVDVPSPLRVQLSSRPTTADTNMDIGLTSSGPTIETRATSWSTAKPSKDSLTAQQKQRESMIEAALLREGNAGPSHTMSNQARAVTVAFSSPPVRPTTPVSDEHHENQSDSIESPNEVVWSAEAERIRTRNNLSSSVVRYATRPLSRIDELENSMELFIDSSPAPRQDLSMVRTPITKDAHQLVAPDTQQSYIPMQLTPLPDFTIHQADQSLNLDVNYVVRKQGLVSHREIEDRFAISIKALVAKIADIEPYEPYWEELQELDLSKNDLFTLHMLDEFCARLECLKVDDNELGQLNGAPSFIRSISARNNCLSDLTAWTHLYNLQYIDVSGNELRSLKGFGDLVHLRELRADNNQIESLDGIIYLDGLLKLSLVRNSIVSIDLKRSRLPRLERLNLAQNEITDVAGLENLPSLRHLSLAHNKLTAMDFKASCTHKELVYLNLANNMLTELDVADLHGLHDLIIDSNSIVSIDGLEGRRHVQRISWQSQRLQTSDRNNNTQAQMDLGCCVDVRTLNLSGNRLAEFALPERFLNLERLDLAACGIKRLASNLGTTVPNVRVLNLSHNALQDLSPLVGIKRLSHLYLLNNRLKDFRALVKKISDIGSRLTTLDCRNNIFNTGYYMSYDNNERQLSVRRERGTHSVASDPFNDKTFLMADADSIQEEEYLKNIDPKISLRRRVYEIMLTQHCQRLVKLDGIIVDRKRIESKDKIWNRLVALGIVQDQVKQVS